MSPRDPVVELMRTVVADLVRRVAKLEQQRDVDSDAAQEGPFELPPSTTG